MDPIIVVVALGIWGLVRDLGRSVILLNRIQRLFTRVLRESRIPKSHARRNGFGDAILLGRKLLLILCLIFVVKALIDYLYLLLVYLRNLKVDLPLLRDPCRLGPTSYRTIDTRIKIISRFVLGGCENDVDFATAERFLLSLPLGHFYALKLFLPESVFLDCFLSHGRFDLCIFKRRVVLLNVVIKLWSFRNIYVDLVYQEIAPILSVGGIRVVLVLLILLEVYTIGVVLGFSATTYALGIRKLWLLTLSSSSAPSFLRFFRI